MAEENKEAKKVVKKETKKEEVKNFEARLQMALSEMPDKLSVAEGQIGNRKYNYTPLPIILNAVRPILAKYDLALMQNVETKKVEGEVIVSVSTSIIDGLTGTYRQSTYISHPIIKTVGGNSLQAMGATITYLRRYSLSAYLGIATEEDTDAQEVKQESREAKPYTPKPKEKNEEIDEEVRQELLKVWNKIKDAHDLGILSDEVYLQQRKAIKSVKTLAGTKAYDKAIDRLIEKEKDKRAKETKETEKTEEPERVEGEEEEKPLISETDDDYLLKLDEDNFDNFNNLQY